MDINRLIEEMHNEMHNELHSDNYNEYVEMLLLDAYMGLIEDTIYDRTLNESMNDEELKRKDKVSVTLEKVKYKGEEGEEGTECECEICFESVKEGDKVYNLDCYHKFHADCLMEWMHYKQDCPVCRTPIT